MMVGLRIGGVLTAACILFGVTACAPNRTVRVGQTIRHDDFLFTVQRVAAHRSGDFTRYDVDMLVENQAARVGYHWTDTIAYVSGDLGKRYAPATHGEFDLRAGESRVAHLRFLVPHTERRPVLRFWDGVFMGDALNGVAYARAGISLPQASR